MTNLITKIVAAAVVALGTIGGVAADANAAQVEVIVKKPVVVRKPVVVVKPVIVKPAVVVRKPVVVVPAARCSQSLALRKAANAGLNKVAVSFVGPNRITVTGRTGGMLVKMNFANVGGCPRL